MNSLQQLDGKRSLPANRGQAPHILVVEDETLLGWSLANILKKNGFEATIAESGEKAIEKINSTPFDLVITDLKLPHIDGFEVASCVKALFPNVPVVMITTMMVQSSHGMPAQEAVDYFLEKPFDLKEMTIVVRELTTRGNTHQADIG
jgi:DNA-binding response OmpR family regulator